MENNNYFDRLEYLDRQLRGLVCHALRMGMNIHSAAFEKLHLEYIEAAAGLEIARELLEEADNETEK